MNIKANYEGKNINFELVNYTPEITDITDINELLKDKENYLWDKTDLEISCEELNVAWDQHTDYYNFYEVEKFNADGYIQDLEENRNIKVEDYIERDYIAVSI